MSRDVLDRASHALRTSADGKSDRALETRARLLANARRQGKSRRHLLVLPLAAALAATSAWAAATGKIAVAWSLIDPPGSAMVAHRETEAAASQLSRLEMPGPTAATAVSAAPEPEPSPSTSATVAPSQSSPTQDPDHAAYLAAHRTHFGGADPATALAAWDGYLRSYPGGRFSLEARYNRALCLVRMGRNAEASQALLPFARGNYGGYRQEEARALREAMGAD